MAKECEVMSKTYEEIRVVPAALRSSGTMEAHGTFSETLGFYITDSLRTALGIHIPNKEATSIIKAEIATVAKKSGEIWVAGDAIFWLSATTEFTNVNDGSGQLVGKAKIAAATGDATGDIVFRDYYPVQRGYLLGTALIPYKIAASDPLIQLLTSSVAITGTVSMANFNLDVLADSAGAGAIEAFVVKVTSAKKTGAWTNAIVGRIDFGTLGDARLGMASAVVGEMNIPGKVTPGGALYCFEAVMNAPENATVSPGHTVAFMKLALAGDATAITSFETNGFLFDVQGVSSQTDGFFEELSVTTTTQAWDACFRIKVGAANYFIPLCDDKAFGT